MKQRWQGVVCILCVGVTGACSSDKSSGNAAVGGAGGSTAVGTTGGAGGAAGAVAGGTTGSSGAGNNPCQIGCVATLAANCSIGPADQASCESDCEALLADTCATQYSALQDCSAGKVITCNAAGIPWIESCSAEQTAFVACLN